MRPRTGRFLIAGATVAFGLVVALLLPARLHEAITGDAAGYNNAAIHLAAEGFYSQDGKVPFVEREPGQSVWLAGIYSVFGLENHAAAFIAQALLYLLACTLFTRELKRVTSTGTATLCFVLLLSLPSVYHVILSLNRECLALSLLLLCATFFLRWQRSHRFLDAAMSGIFLGAVIVTYAVYLLFPFFLLPLIWHLRLPWRQYGAFVACCALVVSLWGIRNERIRGRPCLTGCTRSAEFWYVRGEQAERVRGLEPLWCLWSEYLSRDWTGRSSACSYNGVRNARWPNGFTGTDDDLKAGYAGMRKILVNFPNYLWFSAFEVLELHLPYVDGWGRIYNLLAALGSVVLYFGCALALPVIRRRETLLLAAIPLYTTFVWIFTDATPRYLMPAIFCYAALAALGYGRVLLRTPLSMRASVE